MFTNHVLANKKAAQAASGPASRAILVSFSISLFGPAARARISPRITPRITPRGAPMQ